MVVRFWIFLLLWCMFPWGYAQSQGAAQPQPEFWWQEILPFVVPGASVVIAIVALGYTAKSNRRSERIAKAQIRAYLQFGAPNVPDPRSLGGGHSFELSVTNRGSTPALSVNLRTQTFIADFPLSNAHVLPDNWNEVGRDVVVHPSAGENPATFPASGQGLVQSDIVSVTAPGSNRRVYAAVEATYKDVFGDTIREVYCVSANFGPPSRAELASKHNSYEVTAVS